MFIVHLLFTFPNHVCLGFESLYVLFPLRKKYWNSFPITSKPKKAKLQLLKIRLWNSINMKTICASSLENNQRTIVNNHLDALYRHLGSFGIRRLAYLLSDGVNTWTLSNELNLPKCVISLLRERQGLIWLYLQSKNKPAAILPFQQTHLKVL
jgi:hypothetical protein